MRLSLNVLSGSAAPLDRTHSTSRTASGSLVLFDREMGLSPLPFRVARCIVADCRSLQS
jgi:hypothetical protein